MTCMSQSHYLHFTPTKYIRLQTFACIWHVLFIMAISVDRFSLPTLLDGAQFHGMEITLTRLKGALYRIWCGVNRLGDIGVTVV